MGYGSNYGNRNYGGGYNRGGYNNSQGGGQAPPPPPPMDLDSEINNRIDLFLRIQEAIKARGLDPSEFAFAIGGWTTSLVLEQKKGK